MGGMASKMGVGGRSMGCPGPDCSAATAVPAVCDAEPGVVTHLDLGIVQPRGLVRP